MSVRGRERERVLERRRKRVGAREMKKLPGGRRVG